MAVDDLNPSPDDPSDPCTRSGSVIGCESRTLGEALPIYGTPFSINYQSERAAGFRSRVRINVTGSGALPADLLKVYIDIEAAGRAFHYQRTPPFTLNDTFTWNWDGIDAYGRLLQHTVIDAHVRVSYEYNSISTLDSPSFGSGDGVTLSGSRNSTTWLVSKDATFELRRSDPKTLGFGGWTMSANHSLEGLKTIYFGDGTRRDLTETEQLPLNFSIDTVAGAGTSPNFNDGGQAVGAYLGPQVTDIAVAPDSTLYIGQDANGSNARVRKVTPAGIISTIGGLPPLVAATDGGAALHATVHPYRIAVATDGSVVFLDNTTNQIWKIDTAGILHLVAGNGLASAGNACDVGGGCGDGGPATAAGFSLLSDFAFAPDGAILAVDGGHFRVRRIGVEGTITTIVKAINSLHLITVRPDGWMYVTLQGDSICLIPPSGTTSAESFYMQEPATGNRAYINSDWCKSSASFPGHIVFSPADGSLIMTCGYGVVRRTPAATYQLIAGPADQVAGYAGDGGIAFTARFGLLSGLQVMPNGDIYVGDLASFRVRRIRRPAALNAAGNLLVPSEDASEVYEFSTQGQHLRTRTGLRGQVRYTFGYDTTTNLLKSITDEASNVTNITRTSGAVTITSPYGQVSTINLDANGYAKSVVNPVTTEITTVSHDTNGLLLSLSDPNAHQHSFVYQTDGRLISDTDATPGSPGTRLSATSNATGYAVEITSPEGRVTRHEVTSDIEPPNSSIIQHRKITNGVGLVTQADYAPDGATAVTRPDGTLSNVVAMDVDPRWKILASYPSSVLTQNGSKSMTRTETRVATLSNATDPTSVTAETITTTLTATGGTPVPEATTRVFAGGATPTWTTASAENRQTRETLDSLDRVTKEEILGSVPVTLNPVNFKYDTHGRVYEVDWGARVYSTAFNTTTGFVSSTTVPASLGITYNTRDNDGRPTLMTLPGSRSLSMGYDLAGNVLSVTPPTQPAHIFGFDPNNLLASYMPPAATPAVNPKDTSYSYDKDRLLTLASNPLKPVEYSYDLLGRLLQRTDAVTVTRTYDTAGRLSTVSSSAGVVLTKGYDGTLMTSEKLAVSSPSFARILNKSYDNLFRVASWDIDGTNSIAITYDNDNIVKGAGAMSPIVWSTNGLLTSTKVGSVNDTWGYDTYGAVTSHAVSGSATAFSWSTTRDAAGRLDTKTEAIGGVTHTYKYGYDTAGRLAAVYVDGATMPTRSWTYDGNGNRDGGTYDDQDRMTAFGSATYTYGNNGDLASKTSGGVTTNYSYDANGNLRSTSGGVAITYAIDGEDRRVGKTKGGVFQGFVYDGARLVAELGPTGAEVSRFVYATGDHSPDYMTKTGTTYNIVKDHLGSPRLVVNASTGAVAQRMDFDEWGNVTTDTAPGFQPFGFAGGLWDRDTAMLRFGVRDYDPSTGRFVSKDPSRFGGGDANIYAYVSSDPVNAVDTSGLGPVRYVDCLLKALKSGMGSPHSFAFCLVWLSVPDDPPPAEFPMCIVLPVESLARQLCCESQCDYNQKTGRSTNPPLVCPYRGPDTDGIAASCFERCVSEWALP